MKKGNFFLLFYLSLSSFLVPAVLGGSELATPASGENVLSADTVHEMRSKKVDFVLMDARGLHAYQTEHIEGAVLPLASEYYEKQALFQAHVISTPPEVDSFLKQSTEQYPKDTKLVTYCHKDCQASEVLMSKLKALGFSDVKFMRDGIDAWKEKGYPVVSSVK